MWRRLKQVAQVIVVLIAVFALTTVVQAAILSFRCGGPVAQAQAPRAPTFVCRYALVERLDTTLQGGHPHAVIGIGGEVLDRSADDRHFELCAYTP